MSDRRLRSLQRKARASPGSARALRAYLRELNRVYPHGSRVRSRVPLWGSQGPPVVEGMVLLAPSLQEGIHRHYSVSLEPRYQQPGFPAVIQWWNPWLVHLSPQDPSVLEFPDVWEPVGHNPPGDKLRVLQRKARQDPGNKRAYRAYTRYLRRVFPVGARVVSAQPIERAGLVMPPGARGSVVEWSPAGSAQFGEYVLVSFPSYATSAPSPGWTVSWHDMATLGRTGGPAAQPSLRYMDLLEVPDQLALVEGAP